MVKKMIDEVEEKYLVESCVKTDKWDKEFIIYQWYMESSGLNSKKLKIIFDLEKLSLKYVMIEKFGQASGRSKKQVTYLKQEDLDVNSLKQYPFVMKRRSIKKNIFFDRFIYSNGICEKLVEIEYENEKHGNIEIANMKLGDNVTDNQQYLNQNMTIPFGDKEALELEMLLKVFCV